MLRKLVTGAFLACAALAVGVPSPARAVVVEGSYGVVTTRIAVKLDDRLSSQDNKAGDVFTFELTGSVAAEGSYLAAGTHGHGVVVAVRAGQGPKPGLLTLAARSIDLPDGTTLPVGLEKGSLDRRLTREARGFNVPIGGGEALYVGSNRETNVVYDKGTPFFVIAPPPETPEP